MKNIINKTKAVVAAVLIVVMATLTSCYQKFEESWDLAIDGEQKTFSYEEGMFSVACYTTGRWTARLDRDIVWGHLENTSGHGTGYVRFYYTLNTSVSRSVNLILEANGKSKVIRLIQRTGIGEGAVKFNREAATYANGKYEGRLEIQTNLPDEAFADATPILTFPESSSASLKEAGEGATNEGEGTTGEGEQTPAPTAPDWITDVVYHPAEVTGTDDEGYEIKTKPYITYTVQPNTTGEDRVAVMKYGLTDAAGTEYYAEATLTQEAADGYIILNDTTINRDEQSGVRVAVETNLTEFIDEMVTEVVYPDGETSEYISNVQMTATSASFDIAENTGVKRIATIKVSYTDLNGNKTEGSLRVIQRGETIKRPITASVIRGELTAAGDYVYASVSDDTGDYADVMELIVVGSGAENPNMRKPENTAVRTQNHTLNGKTAYVQTLDGKFGFRIDFAEEADNTLKRGDKFLLLLDGVKITRVENPTRYLLAVPRSSNFDSLTSGNESEIVSNERTIATLTNDDIYTNVTLTDIEILHKGGAYVYGNSTLTGIPESSSGNQFRAHFATMLQDKKGDIIYACINAKCEWKRDLPGGTIQAPQGVGSVHGVLVHEVDKAYGDLGTYQIRPFDQTSFDMPTDKAYAVNQLVDWRLDKAVVSVGQYTWNGNATAGGYIVGTATDAQAQQNKMHGVHGITDGSALFYTTNLKIMTSHSDVTGGGTKAFTNHQYLPGILDGDKGYYKMDIADNLRHNDVKASSKCTALSFNQDVASFYEWSASGDWTGKTTGFVMEFPATAASGKMGVSFSVTPTPFAKTENNNSKTSKYMYKGSTYGYPLYWKVECSTDNGNTWTLCTNAINGSTQFKMNPFINYMCPQSLKDYLTNTTISVNANSDFCPGFTQQKFFLPANAAGVEKVMVKISPASLRLAWFSDNGAWNGSMDVPGHDCTSSYSYPCAIIFEDLAVTYAN